MNLILLLCIRAASSQEEHSLSVLSSESLVRLESRLVVGFANSSTLDCLELQIATLELHLNIDDHVVNIGVSELILTESFIAQATRIE